MRPWLVLSLLALGCGSSVADGDDSLDSTDGPTETGGSSSSTGGADASGGEASSGSADTGGASSGGDASTGGSPGAGGDTGGSSSGGASSGGTGGLAVCSPPALTAFVGSGDDINNLCGWTTQSAPEGYAQSFAAALNCGEPTPGLVRLLASPDYQDVHGKTVWRTPYVSLIDPDATCSGSPMGGVDRIYRIEGQHCVKLSTPFGSPGVTFTTPGGQQHVVHDDTTNCVVFGPASSSDSALVEVRATMNVEGWVRVDTVALDDGECPLECP